MFTFRSSSARPSKRRIGARALGVSTALAALTFAMGGGAASAGHRTADSPRVVNPPILITITGNLYTINPDGTGLKRLTSIGAIGGAAYSPDGTKIVFHKGQANARDLYVMQSDGTGVTRLTNTSTQDEMFASWSPDGKRLAFERGYMTGDRGGIALMNATPGAAQTLIYRNPVAGDGYSETYGRPDWSPKGDRLAIEKWSNYDHSSVNLYLMSLTGKLGRQLSGGMQAQWNPSATWISSTGVDYDAGEWSQKTNVSTGAAVYFDEKVPNSSELVWSPDGTKFVIRADRNGDGYPDLAIMNADGSNVKLLKAGSATVKVTPRSWSTR